jgi:C-terminal processing protease CtpA/Prc
VGVRILQIAPDSPVCASNVRVGDVIIDINGRNVLSLQHQKVIDALVAVEDLVLITATPTQRIVVLPRPACKNAADAFAAIGIHMSMVPGSFPEIDTVVPHGIVATSGQIPAHATIIAIDGVSAEGLSKDTLADLLAKGPPEVEMEIFAFSPESDESPA